MTNTRSLMAAALLLALPASPPRWTQEPPPRQTPAVEAPVEIGRKTGEGERCLVCGERIYGGDIVELRYKGRRFHVAEALLDQLYADPDRYFNQLEARSALFDEDAMQRTASRAWLYFGIYVTVGLLFSALCGALAIGRSLPPLPWFFAGLVGNVAAFAVLMMTPRGTPSAGIPAGLGKVPATRAPVACPSCGEPNHPAASACGGCGHDIEPKGRSEATDWRRQRR